MESIGRLASAASTAAVRAVSPVSDVGLSLGQMVNARVARIEGDTVQLRWGDQTLNVASRVPLSVGQQVRLLVEEGGGGKMLLRMVDDTFGHGRSTRSVPNPNGRGGPSTREGTRSGPPPAVPGWAETGAEGVLDDSALGGPSPNLAGQAGRPTRQQAGGLGRGPASTAAQAPGAAGLATAGDGDPLTALLFESPDGAAGQAGGPGSASRSGVAGSLADSLVARAAMPTYGRLAQSVGGAAAFGQLMASLGSGAGQSIGRGPLAPADLGRLLIAVGLHPDEANAVLVGEMLAQGVAVNEGSVRRLRREIASAGGGLTDAAPSVALSRLGLPITPLSLAIARQLQAGQLDPKAAWGELLAELQGLARDGGAGSQAGMLASELLADWQVPVREGADGIARWLRNAIDQAATPLEAKLGRGALSPGAEHGPATSPGQDVRARLDMLAQTLPGAGRGESSSLSHALQRAQATIQAEQFLNGASTERGEQRSFAITLPTLVEQQPGTVQLRVRERDARPRTPGEPAQPDVVQIRLDLPGLGNLGVGLLVGQHSISCHFSAGSAFAEALLSASSDELVGRLKRLGFAHTAVDATHEPIAPPPVPLVSAPRVGPVDLKA